MDQPRSPDPQQAAAGFDDQIAKSETAFAISAVTAKILSRVAAHSEASAKQIADEKGGLPAIAGNLTALSNTTIAGRGDAKSPLYLTTGDQSLTVKFDEKTGSVIANFLEVINNVVCLRESVDGLVKAVKHLEDQYKRHHHPTPRTHTESGPPIPAFEPVPLTPSESPSKSGTD